MKIKNTLLSALIIMILSSCGSTYRITSDYERGTNFFNYKTYQILKHKKGFPYGINPINRQRIERAIKREMDDLGYQTSHRPDLVVAYFVKERTVREIDHYYRGYYGRWGFPVWVDIHQHQEGTLIIDLIDRANKQVVWHGAAKGRIHDNMANLEEEINEIVHELLEQFSEDVYESRGIAKN